MFMCVKVRVSSFLIIVSHYSVLRLRKLTTSTVLVLSPTSHVEIKSKATVCYHNIWNCGATLI